MKVLNLLTSGHIGGIETLCREIGIHAEYSNKFCFLFDEGIIYRQMQDKKLDVVSLAHTKRISIRKIIQLIKIAKQHDIIVIHHNDPYLKLYFILLKFFCFKKKFACVVHSCYEEEKLKDVRVYLKKKILQLSLSISDVIIFVSQAGLNSYLPITKKEPRCLKVVYNGIGTKILEYGRTHDNNYKDTIKLLYVGRLVKEKGIDDLIEAVYLLKNKYEIELNVVGDGSERSNLENKVQLLNLNENIYFHGKQQNVIPYLESANIFVYPSVCQEVFGISIVEAMSMGLLCVANRVGGISEIITDGKDGFLTEQIGAEYLAGEIERAIKMLEARESKEISQNAKIRAKDFSIDNTVEAFKKIFIKLLMDDK